MDWIGAFWYVHDTWLVPVSVILGIVLTFPVFRTWWVVTIGRERRYRKWHAEIIGRPSGARPSLLVIDLNRSRDITADVERFRQQQETLKDIPEERILKISWQKDMRADDMRGFHKQLLEELEGVSLAGTDVLHRFHSGPWPTAAMTGALLANACEVRLYKLEFGTYTCWGGPRHPLELAIA